MNSTVAAKRGPPDGIAVFRRLALAPGVTLGSLQHGRREEFRIVMAAAARAVDAQRTHTEAEINEALKAWLAGEGAVLATDHVQLRRALVDARLLERDGYGRRYRRTLASPEWQRAIAGLEGVDLEAIAHEARAADAETRAARKARWLERERASAR